MDQPTPVAYLALLAWAPLALLVFSRRGAREGAILAVLGATWVLPKGLGIQPPVWPFIDRDQIGLLTALLGCLVFARPQLFSKPLFTGCEVFLLLMLLGTIPTAFTNPDPLLFGSHYISGLGWVYAVSTSIHQFAQFGLPFILGRRLFTRPSDIVPILLFFVGAAVIYALPMLFEILMSPQLHRIVYGYHPHMFAQQVRGEGFRPTVFVGHGLALAFLISRSVVAALVLYRTRQRMFGLPPLGVLALTWILLLLGKSLAPILYGIAGTLLILLASPKLQMRIAVIVTALVIAYPILRANDNFPTEALLNAAATVSTDREGSLETRLVNEQQLLDKARQRIWFGWGGWGRNRIYDDAGSDISVTDGLWIMVVGSSGIVGFVAFFGLLTSPIIVAAARMSRFSDPRDRILVAGLVFLAATCALDSIPNASGGLAPSLFVAGALAGVVEGTGVNRRPLKRMIPMNKADRLPSVTGKTDGRPPARFFRQFSTRPRRAIRLTSLLAVNPWRTTLVPVGEREHLDKAQKR